MWTLQLRRSQNRAPSKTTKGRPPGKAKAAPRCGRMGVVVSSRVNSSRANCGRVGHPPEFTGLKNFRSPSISAQKPPSLLFSCNSVKYPYMYGEIGVPVLDASTVIVTCCAAAARARPKTKNAISAAFKMPCLFIGYSPFAVISISACWPRRARVNRPGVPAASRQSPIWVSDLRILL